jgi:cell wall-associated NlpC family hydrolase
MKGVLVLTHKHHLFAGPAAAIVFTVALLFGIPAHAAPVGSDTSTATGYRSSAETGSALNVGLDKATAEFRQKLAAKQKELDDFMAQLSKLDAELEIATEEYNASVDRLAEMRRTVETANSDLTKAQDAYRVQTQVLGDRATQLYKDGELNILQVLLDSKSLNDLVMRMKFLNTMGIRDADIALSLAAQRDDLNKRVEDLKTAEAAAQALEFELKARQIEIMLRIDDRQQLLGRAQTELLDMLDAEASRRKSEEQALLNQILAGASAKGISNSPGSPVETALAYHGVPYLWGGETPAGFDCSGLVLYVFRQHGVELPHYSGSQFQQGEKVVPAALTAGDVVFFGSPIHHVGIYMGGGYYIHAPRTGDFVKISRLQDRSDFAGARRYPWQPRIGAPLSGVSQPVASPDASL